MIGTNVIRRIALEVSDEVKAREFYDSLLPEEKEVLGINHNKELRK